MQLKLPQQLLEDILLKTTHLKEGFRVFISAFKSSEI